MDEIIGLEFMSKQKQNNIKDINICNTYGGLRVKSSNGKFYWSIEDYWGDHWLEISEELYNEIIKWDENERQESRF